MRAVSARSFGGSNASGGMATILVKWGIAFVYISSGTISAAGALSAITALPRAYPFAYCWFPANAVATVAAAGWRLVEFSSTTAGTVFLDTYTSGVPSVPASPTAVTDGKGAYVSDTTEHVAVTMPLNAGALGANGFLEIRQFCEYTNTAGTKTFKDYLGGTGGLALFTEAVTTQVSSLIETEVLNAGGQANQEVNGIIYQRAAAAVTPNTITTGTINTAAASTVDFSINKTAAADNAILTWGRVLMMANGG